MALVDALTLVSDAQAFTATGVSTSSYDCGNVTPKRQIGTGEALALNISIDVAADFTTGDETYSFECIQSAASTLTTPTILTRQSYIATGEMITTLLVAGYVMVLALPAGFPTQRYLGFNLTAGGTTPTITLTAWFSPFSESPIKPVTYNVGYTKTN